MVSTSAFAAAAAKGGSSGPIFAIPVRFNISVGAHSGSMVFSSDRTDDRLSYFGVGFDFNVPIKPIHTLTGISAWYVPKGKSGTSAQSSMVLLGLYVGYLTEQNDFFIGPGYGLMSTTLSDTAASPNSSVALSIGAGCGIGGWRHYFSKGFTTGFGINAYTCAASSYTKNVSNTGIADKSTTVDASASATGGYLYFLFGWDESRTLF